MMLEQCFQEHSNYCVMCLSGGSVLAYVRKMAPVLNETKLRFCCEAAAGLAYLESKNCIHRFKFDLIFDFRPSPLQLYHPTSSIVGADNCKIEFFFMNHLSKDLTHHANSLNHSSLQFKKFYQRLAVSPFTTASISMQCSYFLGVCVTLKHKRSLNLMKTRNHEFAFDCCFSISMHHLFFTVFLALLLSLSFPECAAN